MITKARWGVWETNSSTVNQISINNLHKIIFTGPKPILLRTPAEPFQYDSRDPLKITNTQEKVEFVVACILHPGSKYEYDDYPVRIALLLEFKELLEQYTEVEWGFESSVLRKVSFCIDTDLVDTILDMITDEYKHEDLINFIFSNDSYYASDDNGSYYDNESKVLTSTEEDYEETSFGKVYTFYG